MFKDTKGLRARQKHGAAFEKITIKKRLIEANDKEI